MKRILAHLPGGTGPALLGSFASLASQALFALFLLKLFEPQAVGSFSLVNQVAFSWATLALAQSTLTLLADRGDAARRARQAWAASCLRMLWLAPVAGIAWVWSNPGSHPDQAIALAWIAAIAFAQMTWSLAQSLTLRRDSAMAIFLVRCTPPVLAAVLAWFCAQVLPRSEPTALLFAALCGYVVGALWLSPALAGRTAPPEETGEAALSQDDRSSRLKMVHTLFDLVSSTLIAVQWTRNWGAAEAGYLLVLLRVYGFVPALVHTAWAQVLLSRGEARLRLSLTVGAACGVVVVALGAMVELALGTGWLAPAWSGLRSYIWPLALWQVAACVFGCLSHVPFITGGARAYSHQCIAVDSMLVGLLIAAPFTGAEAGTAAMIVAGCMTLALLAQAAHFARRAR
jgi:hypothetical protein